MIDSYEIDSDCFGGAYSRRADGHDGRQATWSCAVQHRGHYPVREKLICGDVQGVGRAEDSAVRRGVGVG